MYFISTFITLIIFVLFILFLVFLKRKRVSFSKRVFSGMGLGLILGVCAQIVLQDSSLRTSIDWINIIGEGYVAFLQMIVMPLVFISILSAIIKFDNTNKSIGKLSFLIIVILIGTSIIAAGVGIGIANIFNLSMDGLQNGQSEIARATFLESNNAQLATKTFASRILDFIPKNIFQDLAGLRNTSTIAVVIFSAILGISSRALLKRKMEVFERFSRGVLVLHDVIMEVVKFILRLTPYGVLALTFKIAATSDGRQILQLGNFIIASYVALLLMFSIHMILLIFTKTNPVNYLKKVMPALTFAFTSRSSAASIPLNVQAQIDGLGINEGIANLSASLGASIGQNGCAAIYPSMLAVMIAPVVGVDPTSTSFILELIAIVAVSSFGVAGVGGGATFAALMVLSNLNFPVALVGLLISVEPLIDMGRTVLNVNGSIVTGVIVSKISRK